MGKPWRRKCMLDWVLPGLWVLVPGRLSSWCMEGQQISSRLPPLQRTVRQTPQHQTSAQSLDDKGMSWTFCGNLVTLQKLLRVKELLSHRILQAALPSAYGQVQNCTADVPVPYRIISSLSSPTLGMSVATFL